MPDAPSPIRPTDAEARDLARRLIDTARFAALAVRNPETGLPAISRIALGTDAEGCPVTLISTLSQHTAALRADPQGAILVGEPASRGDPLTHPRLSLDVRAEFVPRDAPDHAQLRTRWLSLQPKARLYVDFADFGFVRLVPESAALNGGFGRAYLLTPADLMAKPRSGTDG